jgi:polyisoprenoid-binding protein YceI
MTIFRLRFFTIPSWLAVFLASACTADAQPRAIDTQKSVMTVHAFKSGLFSAFAHDHQIAAPIAGGTADIAARQVDLRIIAGDLKVLDPKVSEKDRAEIQKTMLGPDVLDVARHPEIEFRSASAEQSGAGAWKLEGSLILHGQTRPVTVEVAEKAGRYIGTARIRQTDFGIKPVRIAGGTVRVKDELRIEFDIQFR